MCLIISGKASKIRSTLLDTHGMLSDIYTSNSDGVGIMYGTKGGLKVVKHLPKSLADVTAFIRRIPNDDRNLAIHFRYTTHGDTDLLNCHPYDVIPGFVAMMHNGVLHTGNNADKSKSDTWHFIKDYLASAVRKAPDLVFDEGFLSMVGEFIENNRFVFMDGEGRMSIVNKEQGIEHDGMWFSNTYAWTPSKLIPHYYGTKYNLRAYKGYSNYYQDDEYDDHYSAWTGSVKAAHPQEAKFSAHDPRWSEDDSDWEADSKASAQEANDGYEAVDLDPPTLTELAQCMVECDEELFSLWLDAYPAYTLRQLFGLLQPVKLSHINPDDLASSEAGMYQAAFADDVEALIEFAKASDTSCLILSETLCYYMSWAPRKPLKQVAPALLVQ